MSEHTAQSDHTAESQYTAKLSITKSARGKLICKITDYPDKDGKASEFERSWNTLKDVADGTRNTFGRADTVGEILRRAEARAFGWSPSETGKEAIVGGSFWEGAEDPAMSIFGVSEDSSTRLVLKNKEQGNKLFSTSKALNMSKGRSKKLLIVTIDGGDEAQDQPRLKQKWALCKGVAPALSADDIQATIDFLESESGTGLVSKLTSAKSLKDIVTGLASQGTEVDVSVTSEC